MECGGDNIYSNDSDSVPGLYITLGPDVLLSGGSNYEFILGSPIYWR